MGADVCVFLKGTERQIIESDAAAREREDAPETDEETDTGDRRTQMQRQMDTFYKQNNYTYKWFRVLCITSTIKSVNSQTLRHSDRHADTCADRHGSRQAIRETQRYRDRRWQTWGRRSKQRQRQIRKDTETETDTKRQRQRQIKADAEMHR